MYPAKVLLYGEHTILRGGRGLAVPYPHRSLRWEKGQADERLLAFCDYLKVAFAGRELLLTGDLEDALLSGWHLTGDIPMGYGLGSSGAVCAAVWDRFATVTGKRREGEPLRQALARMEQHFHGSSSGTDPLICYLHQPLLLGDGDPQSVVPPAGWHRRFFLVDTGHERNAATLIRRFTGRYDGDAGFAAAVDQRWRDPADRAITALLAGDYPRLVEQTRALSAFQRQEMVRFIPAALHDQWSGESYVLKLCGAGGGGMVLGLLADPEAVTEVNRVFERVEWL